MRKKTERWKIAEEKGRFGEWVLRQEEAFPVRVSLRFKVHHDNTLNVKFKKLKAFIALGNSSTIERTGNGGWEWALSILSPWNFSPNLHPALITDIASNNCMQLIHSTTATKGLATLLSEICKAQLLGLKNALHWVLLLLLLEHITYEWKNGN